LDKQIIEENKKKFFKKSTHLGGYTKLEHIYQALLKITGTSTTGEPLIGGRRRKTKRVSKRLRKSKKFHKRK
jgi:hypothetical protein